MFLLSITNIFFLIFIIVLAAAIIAIVILTIYVSRLIRLSTKLRAKQLGQFKSVTEEGQIVFLGDSLTEFFHLEEFFSGYKIYNRGIAGDTTDGVLERLEDNVISIQPKKVFLLIGTNDFSRHKNEYIFNNIKKIIDKLKKGIENLELYLISLYPVNPKAKFYSYFFTRSRKNEKIIALNELLEEYAISNNLNYLDIHSHLVDENGMLKKEYTIEGLHISFEGYQIIANLIEPFLT